MRGFSSALISSRTRFPSRIRGILLNHNVRRERAAPREQGLRRRARLIALDLRVQFGSDLQKPAVARLPDLEKRPWIEAPFHRAAPVELFLEGLADQVLLQALAAGVLEDSGQPEQLLAVQAGQRILLRGHAYLEYRNAGMRSHSGKPGLETRATKSGMTDGAAPETRWAPPRPAECQSRR